MRLSVCAASSWVTGHPVLWSKGTCLSLALNSLRERGPTGVVWHQDPGVILHRASGCLKLVTLRHCCCSRELRSQRYVYALETREYERVNVYTCVHGSAGGMAPPRVVVVNMREVQDSRGKEAVQREKEGEMKAAGCGMK